MPSSDPIQRFQDILDNISRIEEYTVGMDAQSFAGDRKTYDAVERCLARISEATAKLGLLAETLCHPKSPGRRYEALETICATNTTVMEADRLWFMVEDNLPPLKAAAVGALQKLQEGNAPG